ncbi:MAG: PP2C family protein-serine/threonine phosphatase [bacterium]
MSNTYFGANYAFQLNTQKIIEELTKGEILDDLEFLKKIVSELQQNKAFDISGGRIWKLLPEKKSYTLVFQYGQVQEIPADYQVLVESDPKLFELTAQHTLIAQEEDPILRNKGIFIYSMAGVGGYQKVNGKKYFRYILGFNAMEITQEFYTTLGIISSFVSIKLNEFYEEKQQKRIKKDIFTASTIQRNLFPDHKIDFADYKIFGTCIQSGGDANVGGDYFDYFKNLDNEEERLGILIADAASSGLPAAVQAVFLSGAVKMAQVFSPKISNMVSRLNTLVFDAFPSERPISMCYCEFTLSSNRLVQYANAGHVSPIHYRPSENQFQFLEPTGGLLGILRNQKYIVENVRMLPGDILVLYSDGITEAFNAEGKLFGRNRLQEIIKTNNCSNPEQIVYKIIEEVEKFAAAGQYVDDKTLVVVKRLDTK